MSPDLVTSSVLSGIKQNINLGVVYRVYMINKYLYEGCRILITLAKRNCMLSIACYLDIAIPEKYIRQEAVMDCKFLVTL
jgi:hypothetical protein